MYLSVVLLMAKIMHIRQIQNTHITDSITTIAVMYCSKMVTNHRITGSVYNFKASGLTMKPQALADMLNAHLV